MRILVINYEYPPLGAGAGHATQQWVKQWLAQGHEILLFTGKFPGIGFPDQHANLTVLQVEHGRPSPTRANLFSFLRFLWNGWRKLPRWVKTHRPDTCLTVFLFPCGPLAWWLKRRLNLPYVLALRGGDVPGAEPSLAPLHKILAPVRRAIYRQASGVFANSQGLKDLAERHDAKDVHIIPNGVDTRQFFPPTSKSDTTVRFLFAGRFQSQKNLAFTLTCMDRVLANLPHAEFELVGEGPLREMLMQQIAQLQQAKRIHLLPWQSPEELRKRMSEAHLLINLSLYEGMPNIVLQAAACGLPSLVSDVIGNREVVQPEKTGWCLPLDRERIIETATRLGRDPHTLIQVGRNASEWVRSHYSWAQSAQQLYDLLVSSDQVGRMSK
ncbi:MAG: glycosyltransferase family 4 protein [Acidobacteria bacterium]|nr:glycosyltransferase family 4 protein [Acidobacteriota bacterium]